MLVRRGGHQKLVCAVFTDWTEATVQCSLLSSRGTDGLSRASQIKLGPPLFVPNSQVGTFGAVSQIRSLIRSRADLFDVSFAGPAAAAAVSAALFVAGLVLSSGGVPKVSVACLEMHPVLAMLNFWAFRCLQFQGQGSWWTVVIESLTGLACRSAAVCSC